MKIIITTDLKVGEVTVKDAVMTINKSPFTSFEKNNVVDVEVNKNFSFDCVSETKLKQNEIYECEVTLEGETYTFNGMTGGMTPVEDGYKFKVKYVDGLSSDDSSSDDSSDEDEHTLRFGAAKYTCSYDERTSSSTPSNDVVVYYDDEPIEITAQMISGDTYCNLESRGSAAYVFVADNTAPEISTETYTDLVTVTYEGLTASCEVDTTFFESEQYAFNYYYEGHDSVTSDPTMTPISNKDNIQITNVLNCLAVTVLDDGVPVDADASDDFNFTVTHNGSTHSMYWVESSDLPEDWTYATWDYYDFGTINESTPATITMTITDPNDGETVIATHSENITLVP